MKKFMVIINQKVIVSVEAESNSQAEHIFCNLYGVKSALAFDVVEEGGLEFYRGYIERCDTRSREEIVRKSNEQKAKVYEAYNEMFEEEWYYKQELRRIEESLARMKGNLEAAQAERKEFEIQSSINGLQLKGTPIKKEVIEKLKNPSDEC